MPQPVEQFREHLDALRGPLQPDQGFFDANGVFWRVAREPALLLAGMRALLMQVAHPKVAQGVADHSRYRDDPLGRGIRTFTAVYAMVFGSADTAVEAAARVRDIHRRVRGVVPAALPAGVDPAYAATDSQLALWVAATLVDSSVVAYELFVEPLSAADKEQFYQESKRFGELFGIARDCYPPGWNDFRAWMNGMLSGPAVSVTATARDIRRSLLGGTVLTRLLAPANYVMAAMLLPQPLADAYGLRRNAPVRLGFRLIAVMVRLAVRLVPRRLRGVPAARRRERQLRRARATV
ncbi:MAG: oxygenase MpaB family protein [Gammaproteobacteria bacterium]